MTTSIFRVVAQGTVSNVPSRKAEGGQTAKCEIQLQELGGANANKFVCAMFGNLAHCEFRQGDTVAATLRFAIHEAKGYWYQDVTVCDIVKLNTRQA